MFGLIGLAVLVLDIIAIISIVQSGKPANNKILWLLLVVLLPMIGMVLYFAIGKKG